MEDEVGGVGWGASWQAMEGLCEEFEMTLVD